jgi:hypothetical protein
VLELIVEIDAAEAVVALRLLAEIEIMPALVRPPPRCS